MDPLAFLAGAAVAAGACAAWVSHRRVVQLQRQLTAERHAASHDPLTGLPNRRAFYMRGAELVADPHAHPLVAVVLDVDGFKQINDVYGHSAGDEVLVTIGHRFSSCAGKGIVARLGGDEFAGLIPGRDEEPDVQAAQLADVLAAPMRLGGQVVSVSTSVGLVPVGASAHLADAVHRADAAMYRAKRHTQRHSQHHRAHLVAHQHVLHTSLRLAKPAHPTSAT
ncbi:GGDEF domain-containing protein [Dactylosporangium sp. NPDC005555]|uniref:GGDEF domain-containing protein n=1 Tax=Dactylosporangium sp. NPDC005555 TaxID=3154889 RepID=UPI0033BAA023